jgi:hypothetical protein
MFQDVLPKAPSLQGGVDYSFHPSIVAVGRVSAVGGGLS